MPQSSAPSAPDPAKTYKQGLQIYLKYLPTLLGMEQGYRGELDPQRIASQQALQQRYGPTQYSQQLDALRQLDPTGQALRSQLGTAIGTALTRGSVSPEQGALYGNLSNYVQSGLSRGGLDPTQTAAYNQLGQQVRGDIARGTQLTPEFSRQLQQSVRAGQSARGNVLGNDAASAEALYQGQRAQQLYQQRVGNVQNFTALPSPGTTAYQAGAQLYGMQSPQAQALAQAGSFLSSPTPEQQLLAVQGVSPDRSSAYVNPNAGYLAQQFGLQNYQNLLAQQAASGGGGNPWASALGGAASGATAGSSFGPYGAVIGGVAGAGLSLGQYYSDDRLKTNMVKVGEVEPGIDLVRFNFISDKDRTFEGVSAQQVIKVHPEMVHKWGEWFVVDYDKLGLKLREVF